MALSRSREFRKKSKELEKKVIKINRSLPEKPTVSQIKQVMEPIKELIEIGNWVANRPMAYAYGRIIWVILDHGGSSVRTLPPEKKEEVLMYATSGLLHLNILYEHGEKQMKKQFKKKELEEMEKWRQEFNHLIELAKSEGLF